MSKNQIRVVATLRYPDDKCKKLVRFPTEDGRIVEKAVGMEVFDNPKLLQKELRGFLCDFKQEGVSVTKLKGGRKLRQVITQRGWQDSGCFVGPMGAIGPRAGSYHHDADILKLEHIEANGTPKRWQQGVSKAMRYSPALTLCLGMGLATSLMKFFGANTNRLVVLVAPTSSGKTTVELAIMSLHGKPDASKMASFNMAEVSLTNHMAKWCDLPTIVDEAGTAAKQGVSPQDKIRQLVYEVSSQSGRTRHEMAGYAAEVSRTILFTSSEAIILPETDGQKVRMLNIPVAEPSGVGIFSAKVGGEAGASRLHANLAYTIEHHYGHAGPAFLLYIMELIEGEGEETFKKKLRKRVRDILAELEVGEGTAAKRAAEPFAWAVIALQMAVECGIFPRKAEKRMVKQVFKMYRRTEKLTNAEAVVRRKALRKTANYLLKEADAGAGKVDPVVWLRGGYYHIRREKLLEWLVLQFVPAVQKWLHAKLVEVCLRGEDGKATVMRGFTADLRRRHLAIPESFLKQYAKPAKNGVKPSKSTN